MNHELYMQRALALAAKGAGWVNPNPQVGAVIVSATGEVIGEGWHTAWGKPHAEREALADCIAKGNNPKDSTVYVTLEPCCHTGKQPPCTDALIQAGVARVVMGAPDPNPLVSGKGVRLLEDAGIEVVQGVMVNQCQKLNRAWLSYIQTKRPYVTIKYAMTLDVKIATHTGSSKWITGQAARARVHEDRAKAAGILVGIGTVLADDPMLTARDCQNPNPHQPARFVLDASCRTPLDSKLVASAAEIPTYIICTNNAPQERRDALEQRACRIWSIEACGQDLAIDIDAVLSRMGKAGIDSLIVEGGAKTIGGFVDAQRADFCQAYIASKIVGGSLSPSPVGGCGIELMGDAATLEDMRLEQLGDDLLVSGAITYAKDREVR